MTNQECEVLFLKAMEEKRIVCYENRGSKDHYHIHAYRRAEGRVIFFCLIETFFQAPNDTKWLEGSIRSFHEFSEILGATAETLLMTEENFLIEEGFESQLPVLSAGEKPWIKVG